MVVNLKKLYNKVSIKCLKGSTKNFLLPFQNQKDKGLQKLSCNKAVASRDIFLSWYKKLKKNPLFWGTRSLSHFVFFKKRSKYPEISLEFKHSIDFSECVAVLNIANKN